MPKKVCWENGEWRVRNQTRGGSVGKNVQNQNEVKLEQKRESELPNWVRLDHHSTNQQQQCYLPGQKPAEHTYCTLFI